MKAAFRVWRGEAGRLDIALSWRYTNDMDTQKQLQEMSVYFPLHLLERVRQSAQEHKRSFTMEALWLVEQGLKQEQKKGK